jgi:protein phosphatase
MIDNPFARLLTVFKDSMDLGVPAYEIDSGRLVLPALSFVFLQQLIGAATDIFSRESVLLELDEDLVVVGDLHGHILDLFRILTEFGMPPTINYLFLGDLVDRGQFSTETAVLILTLKVLWPASVFLIRGNHEFREMWESGGFTAELQALYPNDDAASEFEKVFSVLPVAALLRGTILCAHGGIGPHFTSVQAIKGLQRPILDFEGNMLRELLWSDPSPAVQDFQPSIRGLGVLFGHRVLANFLWENGLTILVRAHECVDQGCLAQFDGLVVTVFSASAYCNQSRNQAGALLVRGEVPSAVTFPPIRPVMRRDIHFVTVSPIVPIDAARIQKLRAGTASAITRWRSESHSSMNQFLVVSTQRRLGLMPRSTSGKHLDPTRMSASTLPFLGLK